MILRARTVVPILGEPIEDGAVAVDGEKIAGVGTLAEIRKAFGGKVLDLGEQVLLPGLVNAHCHLDYTILRNRIPRQRSFADWIVAINTEKAKLTEQDYIHSIEAGFAEAVRFGTTAMANLTALPKLAGAINSPMRTWWFGELIDVRNPDRADEIAEAAAGLLKSQEHWGLAPHAPYTASSRLYARCKEIARRENVPLTTHLAESREEMQMFRDATGPAFEFLQSIGRPMDDCGRETPLSRFQRTRQLDERWIVAHLNELDAGDLELLAKAPKFHIAHCPRSHAYFGHSPFALEKLRDLGFNVCLGTDSLASNDDLSLFAEMRELLRQHPGVAPRAALEMATINGAAALGKPEQLGCICAGAFADLIAMPIPHTSDVYENIVAFDGEVPSSSFLPGRTHPGT